ncbi:MAG: uracil phosphoribosyltransferase [Ignavibacteriales bacterium]|nr:uracil phosphoribosyltransferase [Ignavibacteriales bacterium]MCB9209961.1 uracil phosphoribosyltransferase [Ignavibacteriales bacterium]MCB9218654.1 uracil phosphoribosyltransferase [Ignavibacteriales bacterium]MCB9259340.1 uracil phosphoribosyltransferase [Ignavibacteriales bacterium]
MKNLTVVSNPLILRDITYLRNKETKEYQFRLALRRIAYALAIEISKEFEMIEFDVETPLEITKGYNLKKQIVLVPVLRAGLSLVNSFIEMIPNAKVGHIGLQRDEKTLKPVDYYYKAPKNLDISKVIVLDPMLATGGSSSAAFTFLKNKGAVDCVMASLIASPEGIEKLSSDHPDVPIYTAMLDRELNENGFILPGLGDAGDRTFGTL